MNQAEGQASRSPGGDRFARHMEAVARHLLGAPNKARSTKTELRYGTNGSLAVDLVKGTWFDFEGGIGGGVLDLIARQTGLANGSAFDWLRHELGIQLDPESPGQACQQRRIVATYDYHDERGKLLFQVVRFDPKDFRQRRPDAAARDGWNWSTKGLDLVPYRLPELLAAETVFIVEGERDANTLARAGIVATCNPGGAGKWPESFGRWFGGRHVIIVPDKDEAGRKHAQDVARKLAGKAASIKVLELPGTAKDVTVWFEAGGTPERLLELALEASPWKPEAEAPIDWKDRLADAIVEMNARYFVVAVGGRGVVATIERDECLHRQSLAFLQPRDVKLLHGHRHYVIGIGRQGQELRQDLGSIWLRHLERRTYERMALLPNQTAPAGVYNLWQGWGIEPKAGEWPIIRAYLFDVVCGGDDGHFQYLLGWCAHCVQHPERQAEVAVVLRGLKGTGKGTLGRLLRRIFLHHALHITQPRHLTGNFNAHLADCLFLFVDESFWAGDKQGDGTLKGLVTEDTVMIERKGMDAFMMPNRLKILMASNNDWVVPATADERRYFVLDVADVRKGNLAYFNGVHEAINGGEGAAFLHELLHRDLTGFNIRAVPHTRGLATQKLVGADSVTRFWYDCLREGAIVGSGQDEWPGRFSTQMLHACYLEHARDHGERHPVTDAEMVTKLRALWQGCNVRHIRSRTVKAGQSRPRLYSFACLYAHRTAFLTAMNINPDHHEWPNVEEEEVW